MKASCWCCLVAVIWTSGAVAQQPPVAPPVDSLAVLSLRLTDGSTLLGRVVAQDDTSLVVVTVAGLRLVVPRRALEGWRRQPGALVGGRFLAADPNTSRLFFTPTGRTLRRGDGYFADYYLFFPFVAVGLHDRLTVAAGMSLFPGASEQLLYVAPKVGVVQSPRANLSVGGIYATIPGEGSIGAGYGAFTYGTEDNAVTLVAGYPFADGDVSDAPGLVVGGETRVSRRSKLLFEAWKLPDVEDIPAVFGVRFFGERISVDFGLIHVLGGDVEGFPFFPWVDFVVNW